MIIIVLSFVESEANVAQRVFSFSLIALITTLCVQESPSTRSPIVPSIFIIYGRERVTMFQLTATSLSLVLILRSLTLHCPSTPVYLFVPFCFRLMVRRDLPTSFLCTVSLLTLYTKIKLQSAQLPRLVFLVDRRYYRHRCSLREEDYVQRRRHDISRKLKDKNTWVSVERLPASTYITHGIYPYRAFKRSYMHIFTSLSK